MGDQTATEEKKKGTKKGSHSRLRERDYKRGKNLNGQHISHRGIGWENASRKKSEGDSMVGRKRKEVEILVHSVYRRKGREKKREKERQANRRLSKEKGQGGEIGNRVRAAGTGRSKNIVSKVRVEKDPREWILKSGEGEKGLREGKEIDHQQSECKRGVTVKYLTSLKSREKRGVSHHALSHIGWPWGGGEKNTISIENKGMGVRVTGRQKTVTQNMG